MESLSTNLVSMRQHLSTLGNGLLAEEVSVLLLRSRGEVGRAPQVRGQEAGGLG